LEVPYSQPVPQVDEGCVNIPSTLRVLVLAIAAASPGQENDLTVGLNLDVPAIQLK
jgi:hypothetical protein